MAALQQMAQQPPVHAIDAKLCRPCSCLHCQSLQAFLSDGKQLSLVIEDTHEAVHHMDGYITCSLNETTAIEIKVEQTSTLSSVHVCSCHKCQMHAPVHVSHNCKRV